VRVAAAAGAGKRHASEQRIAIRDFGTCTHTHTHTFLSFPSSSSSDLVCKITHVCVGGEGGEGRNFCLPFIWEGKCIKVGVSLRRGSASHVTC
jgi:hypothetical protein